MTFFKRSGAHRRVFMVIIAIWAVVYLGGRSSGLVR